MRRTVQTTLNALQWLVDRGTKVECDASWQENSNKPCDTGSAIETIADEFPHLDFSKVDKTYPDKSESTPYAFTKMANASRGQGALRKLIDRPEKVIAVVSHAGFLRTAISNRRFANADYRIFCFKTDAANDRLTLAEDSETEKRGGGMGRSEIGVFEVREWDFPLENPEDT